MSKTKKQTAVEWLVEQIQNDKIEIIYSDKIYSIIWFIMRVGYAAYNIIYLV